MKLKRNLITLMVVSLLVTSLTACSGKQTDTTKETETTSDVVEATETTVDEDLPHGSREDGHADGHETIETTVETTINNAPAYDPEVESNYGVSIRPLCTYASWSTAASDIERNILNYLSANNLSNTPVENVVCWIPDGNAVSQYPMQFDINGQDAYDTYNYFSTDSYNLIFECSREMCVIVSTDANVPTLMDIYNSTDGSMTIDEMIANRYGGIIVPEYVDRNDTARIDAELATVNPDAHIAEYNRNAHPNYNIIPVHDIFSTPGVYYIRCYIKDDNGEWHTTCSMAQFNNGIATIPVVDFVAEGIDTDYCYE